MKLEVTKGAVDYSKKRYVLGDEFDAPAEVAEKLLKKGVVKQVGKQPGKASEEIPEKTKTKAKV